MSFQISKEHIPALQSLMRDSVASMEAREEIASIYSASLSRVVEPLSLANGIFTEVEVYSGNNVPEIPLGLFFGAGEGTLRITANGYPGGLEYNEISGFDTFRYRTYNMNAAWAYAKAYAEDARLNIQNLAMTRIMDEILIKSQGNAFTVLAEALGKAVTNDRSHVIQSYAKSTGAGHKFQIEDVNALKVLMDRLNDSFAFGTARNNASELTDLYMSPELIGDVRRMSYNPMNTYGVPDSAESTALGLPDSVRSNIFASGGLQSIWDIRIHKMSELGVGGPYTQLFRQWYTGVGAGAPTWNPATDEIVIGINANMGAFARVVQADGDGNVFQVEVDDQFRKRQEKIGYYGQMREGWVIGNDNAIVGLIV